MSQALPTLEAKTSIPHWLPLSLCIQAQCWVLEHPLLYTLAVVISTGHKSRTRRWLSNPCFWLSIFRARSRNRHKTCLNSVNNTAAWLLKQHVTLEHLLSFLWCGPVVNLLQFVSFVWFGFFGWVFLMILLVFSTTELLRDFILSSVTEMQHGLIQFRKNKQIHPSIFHWWPV